MAYDLETKLVTWGSASARGKAALDYSVTNNAATYVVKWTLYACAAYEWGTKVTATLSGGNSGNATGGSGSTSVTPSSATSSWSISKKTGTMTVTKTHSSQSIKLTIKASSSSTSSTESATKTFSVSAKNSYTIKYDANGGSDAPSSQTKWHSETLTLSTTKPTRTGYTFLGWSTSSTATSATYAAGGSYTSNSGATLYAVWSENTYTVTYNGNGGSTPNSQTKKYFTNLILNGVSTRDGYVFAGWSTSSTATVATYTAEQITSGTATYSTNAATTLYAVWTPAQFTVSFMPNGTKVENMPSNQTFDGLAGDSWPLNITFTTTPKRTFYNFVGWSTSSTAVTAQYVLNNTYSFERETTLYAVWSHQTATQYFYGKTSTSENTVITTQTVYRDAEITLPTVSGVANKYEFLGWTNSTTYGKSLTAPVVVTYDTKKSDLTYLIQTVTLSDPAASSYTYYGVYRDVSPSKATLNSYETIRPLTNSTEVLNDFETYVNTVKNGNDYPNTTMEYSNYIFGYLNLNSTVGLTIENKELTKNDGEPVSFSDVANSVISNNYFIFGIGGSSIDVNTPYILTLTGTAENGKPVEYVITVNISAQIIDVTGPYEDEETDKHNSKVTFNSDVYIHDNLVGDLGVVDREGDKKLVPQQLSNINITPTIKDEYKFEGDAYAVFDSSNNLLTFFRSNSTPTNTGTKTYYSGIETSEPTTYNEIPWYSNATNINTVIFEDQIKPTHTNYWFYGCTNLKSIENLDYLDTSDVVAMNNMFHNCKKITTLDVSHFDTSNVTNMSAMFHNCNKLTTLDVSHFDTSNVTNTQLMFSNCHKLDNTTLFVLNMPSNYTQMFDDCSTDESVVNGVFVKTEQDTINIDALLSTKSENSKVSNGGIGEFIEPEAPLPVNHPDSYSYYINYELPKITKITDEDAQKLTFNVTESLDYSDIDNSPISVNSGDIIYNPTLFDSSPIIKTYGTGNFNINNSQININNTFGDIVVRQGTQQDWGSDLWLPLTNVSNLNIGDSITCSNIKIYLLFYSTYEITSTSVISATNCTGSFNEIHDLTITLPDVSFNYGSDVNITAQIQIQIVTSNSTITPTIDIEITNSGQNELHGTYSTTGFNKQININSSYVVWEYDDVIGTSTKSIGEYVYFDFTEDANPVVYTLSGTTKEAVDSTKYTLPTPLPTLKSGSNIITFDNTITEFSITPNYNDIPVYSETNTFDITYNVNESESPITDFDITSFNYDNEHSDQIKFYTKNLNDVNKTAYSLILNTLDYNTDEKTPRVMFGEGLEVVNQNQTAIGKYNDSQPDDKIAFYIGNGTLVDEESDSDENANRSNALTVDWYGNATFSGSGAMVVAESDDTNTRTEFTAARTDTNVAAGVIVGSGGENRGLYQWSDYENRADGSWIIYQSSNGINLPNAPYIANHDSPIGTNITGSYKFTNIAASSSLREIGKLKNSSGTDVTFNAGVWIVSVSVRLASYTGSFAAQLTGRSSSYASVMAGTSGTWAVSITDCVYLSSNSTISIAERHGTGSKDVEVYWSAIRIV